MVARRAVLEAQHDITPGLIEVHPQPVDITWHRLGLRDQLIFTEIDYLKVDKARGMNVCVVTTAKTDEEARKLLQLLGMPFRTN